MTDQERINKINKELESGSIRPERVIELLKELKKLGYYKAETARKGGIPHRGGKENEIYYTID